MICYHVATKSRRFYTRMFYDVDTNAGYATKT
jgi:hypothetical protein